MHVCLCLCGGRAEENLTCCTQIASTLIFETGTLIGLMLTNLVRLATIMYQGLTLCTRQLLGSQRVPLGLAFFSGL